MSTLRQLEDRLRATVFKNRIRLNEFFKDYDPLRSGFVTQSQFRRCVDILQLELTETEFKTLVDMYGDETRGVAMVGYLAFCESIDKAFTEKNLETKPLKDLFDIHPKLLETRRPNEMRMDEKKELQNVLQRIKEESDYQGYIIKESFMDFDPLRHGVVTRDQFLSCLPFSNIGQHEKSLLIKRYVTSGTFVNYYLFHDEVNGQLDEETGIRKDFLVTSKRPATTMSTPYAAEPIRADMSISSSVRTVHYDEIMANETENIIRSQLLKHRVRIDDTMRDFDPLNRGHIAVGQFKQSIGALKLSDELKHEHVDALTDKYTFHDRDGMPRVDYRSFIKQMYLVFTDPNLETKPLGTVQVPTELLVKHRRVIPQSEREKRVQQLLDELRELVATRRIFIKPVFQDFDKAQRGTFLTHHITRTRFLRALAMLDLSISPQDCELLCERYDVQDNGSVNYMMFIEDIDF